MTVGSVATDTLTVTRGTNGSSAATHSNGANIFLTLGNTDSATTLTVGVKLLPRVRRLRKQTCVSGRTITLAKTLSLTSAMVRCSIGIKQTV